jgi:hypothetical protein
MLFEGRIETTVRERGGVVTSSALWASSPKGEDSALGVLCTTVLRTDLKWSVRSEVALKK